MQENIDLSTMITTYAVPWIINIGLALAIFLVGRAVARILVSLVGKLMSRAGMDPILVNFVTTIANAGLLLFIVIAALDKLGVDTTSLIAVLGAAGLAVGLALQGSLQNFAAGVMLVVFRPFKAGDFVEAGGTSGVVESITIFNSVFLTGDNREVIVPNGSIYGGTIVNYSARDTRRVDMIFGIGYGDDLLKAKNLITRILGEDPRVLKDPAPLVAVAELADCCVNINVRPWVKSSDYWAVKFDTIERLKLAFDEHGISIPFPQIDVHMGNV